MLRNTYIKACFVAVCSFMVIAFICTHRQEVKTIRVSTVDELSQFFDISENKLCSRFKLVDAASNDSEEFTIITTEGCGFASEDDGEELWFKYPADKGCIIINDLYHTNEFPVAQMMITRNINESLLANRGQAHINITKKTSIAHLIDLIRFVKRLGDYQIGIVVVAEDYYEYYKRFLRP